MRKPALPQPYRRRVFLDRPEPGWFRLKLARRGVWVPALIWQPCPFVEPLEAWGEMPGEPPEDWCRPTDPWRGPRVLRARIGDDEADPLEVWSRGYRVGEAEYRWRVALREWARTQPAEPEAQPRRAVDLSGNPSLF